MPAVGAPARVIVRDNDDLTAYLDQRLRALDEEPTPTPSPSPTPNPGGLDPIPTPSPTPTPDPGEELVTLVQQIAQDEKGTRIASSGSFEVLCLSLSVLIALTLFIALRRR